MDGLTGPISGTINGETYSGTRQRKDRRSVERSAAMVGLEFDNTVSWS